MRGLPDSYQGFRFAPERMADCIEELSLLYRAHWQETEGYRHSLPFNPDYAKYLEYERIGYFHLFTARLNGRLVGNCGMYVQVSMHTQEMVATEDTLFILREARKGLVAIRFVRFVHQQLKRMGVTEVRATVKNVNRAGTLLERLGYQAVAIQYSKIL